MIAYIAAPSRAEDPERNGRDLVIMFNSTGDNRDFKLPEIGRGTQWVLFLDSAAVSPEDVFPDGDGPVLSTGPRPCHSECIA